MRILAVKKKQEEEQSFRDEEEEEEDEDEEDEEEEEELEVVGGQWFRFYNSSYVLYVGFFEYICIYSIV